MEATAIITGLIGLYLLYLSYMVGVARGKFEINAPKMSGDEQFERVVRVHMNMVEQSIVFLPAMWIFALYIHGLAAAGLGVAFLVGRILYRQQYLADPGSRTAGFLIGFAATVIALLGGIGGAAWAWCA